MKSFIIKRKFIIILILGLFVVFVTWNYKHFFSGFTKPCSNDLILVSAHVNFQERNGPGNIIFSQLNISSEHEPPQIKVLRTIDIDNRRTNYYDEVEGPGKVRNLIKGHETDVFYYYDYNEFLKIQYDKKSGRILTGDSIGVEGPSYFYGTDIDSREENIILNYGGIIKISKPKLLFDYINKSPDTKKVLAYHRNLYSIWGDKDSQLRALNVRFLDTNTAIMINQDLESKNYIVISSSDNKKCKYIQQGYFPSTYFRQSIFAPMDFSPDKKLLSFLTADKINQYDYRELCLNVYNIEENKTEEIIKLLNKDEYTTSDFRPNHLQWNPVDANLILFYSRAREKQSSLFSIDSFTDWQSLIQCLKNDKSPYIERVRSFLNAKSLKKIAEWKPDTLVDESMKNLIIEDFNNILGRRDFYKPEISRNIKIDVFDELRVKTEFKKSSQEDIVRFNKGVFDQIFFSHLPYQYFDLINLSDKSKTRLNIHHELSSMVKNFRWSPDGKKIGIIDYNGRLYIYDLEKKTTKKVNEDPDCFDFFWVE